RSGIFSKIFHSYIPKLFVGCVLWNAVTEKVVHQAVHLPSIFAGLQLSQHLKCPNASPFDQAYEIAYAKPCDSWIIIPTGIVK
ncbi:hypothetical protein OU790_19575, partial [Ruegeria sp. NA]